MPRKKALDEKNAQQRTILPTVKKGTEQKIGFPSALVSALGKELFCREPFLIDGKTLFCSVSLS
jgi:hypothetical protein